MVALIKRTGDEAFAYAWMYGSNSKTLRSTYDRLMNVILILSVIAGGLSLLGSVLEIQHRWFGAISALFAFTVTFTVNYTKDQEMELAMERMRQTATVLRDIHSDIERELLKDVINRYRADVYHETTHRRLSACLSAALQLDTSVVELYTKHATSHGMYVPKVEISIDQTSPPLDSTGPVDVNMASELDATLMYEMQRFQRHSRTV